MRDIPTNCLVYTDIYSIFNRKTILTSGVVFSSVSQHSHPGNDWEATLESANELASTLRTRGYHVQVIRAGHVTPEPPSYGDSDRFGLVYLVGDSNTDPLQTIVDKADFTEYKVFNRQVGEELYLLTQIIDTDNQLAVLLVGTVNLTRAEPLMTAVQNRGELYSYIQLVDGTVVSRFQHGNPTTFFESNT